MDPWLEVFTLVHSTSNGVSDLARTVSEVYQTLQHQIPWSLRPRRIWFLEVLDTTESDAEESDKPEDGPSS
jgi:hypothetical protein